MKKIIIIALFSLVASFANAQTKMLTHMVASLHVPYQLTYRPVTVTSGKISITLNYMDYTILTHYEDPQIKKALETMRVIKNNSTADIIIAILRTHKD